MVYVLCFILFVVGSVRSMVENIDLGLVKVVCVLGVSLCEVFMWIMLLLIFCGMIVGVVFVFLEVMCELFVMFMLGFIGFEILVIYMWWVYEVGYFGCVVVLGFLFVLLLGVGLIFMLLGERKV